MPVGRISNDVLVCLNLDTDVSLPICSLLRESRWVAQRRHPLDTKGCAQTDAHTRTHTHNLCRFGQQKRHFKFPRFFSFLCMMVVLDHRGSVLVARYGYRRDSAASACARCHRCSPSRRWDFFLP